MACSLVHSAVVGLYAPTNHQEPQRTLNRMKIACTELDLTEGKVKYQDPIFIDLAEKFQPAKVSPFYFELLLDDYEAANAIAIASESVLDLLILDFEKVEGRLARTEDAAEKEVLEMRPGAA